jgi:sigma-B regulation protein RsbU (phosphoserine phosphatase)
VIPFRYEQTVGLLSVHFTTPQPLTAHASYYALVAALLAGSLERARAQEEQVEHLRAVEAALAERDRIARTLSTALLPPRLPALAGFSAAGWLLPADGGEVAGDFYDLFAVEGGGWVAILGDVCGKGAEAAAVAALARYAARATALTDPNPAAIASVADLALRNDSSPLFCTMAVAHLRPQGAELEVALAGHPQIRCVGPGGIERIGEHGSPLGIRDGSGVRVDTKRLPVGATVVLFSDGLIEHSSAFGDDELDAALGAIDEPDAESICERLRTIAADLAPDHPDDIAVLAITRTA